MSRECLDERQIQAAIADYKAGADIEDIAAKYYVCAKTLYRMFKRRKCSRKGVRDIRTKTGYNVGK